MANKQIADLSAANAVQAADLFVLEQDGTAKKLTGQILENWLLSFADAHWCLAYFSRILACPFGSVRRSGIIYI